MTSPELERLVQIGTLKKEPGAQAEIDGLVRSARSRLTDAGRSVLALESRFDLAYNAAHALSLAAIAGKPSDDVAPGTLNSILKQAKLT